MSSRCTGSKYVGSGSTCSASGRASGSGQIHTKPKRRSQRTSPRRSAGLSSDVRPKSSGSRTNEQAPSRSQRQPWNGQVIWQSASVPQPWARRVPRCRQELKYARISSGPLRTTRNDWSAIPYSTKEPTAGSSSSRQATCHVRGHNRSASSCVKARVV